METDLLSVALSAGAALFTFERLAFLFGGVLLGLVLGVIPGLGGLVGLTMLLPFTYSMDTTTALAFLLGLYSVTATSDTIPSVLFGVPGTIAAQATIMDGHPMARQGRAPEALGAAFSASVIGGLFGAIVLGISIPVLRPVMLQLATPELLAIVLVGLSLVSVLAGTSPMKGLIVGCIGLMLSTVGQDSQTGSLRWTLDTLYLYEGLPVPIVALGIFAIPEMATLVIGRVKIAQGIQDTSLTAQMVGVRATLKNWFLVLRCSSIGTALGAMPGVGSSVVDWITYAHAKSSEKGASETFGTGDVRGVIAPESANNAKEGGSLVPTIAFGIPGGAAMAILLGAFIIQGITPGPDMLSTHLDITYSMVWSVGIANILGAGLCFLLAGYLARIALLPYYVLAPIVLALVFVGAYQATNSWADLVALFFFGALGLVLKMLGWPRPPLVLGFVLGGVAERYAFISTSRYGWDWTTRPVVAVLLLIAVFLIIQPLVRDFIKRFRTMKSTDNSTTQLFKPQWPVLNGGTAFVLALVLFFIWALFASSAWPQNARFFPAAIATGALIFLSLHILGRYVFAQPDTGAGGLDVGSDDLNGLESKDILWRTVRFTGLVGLFFACAYVFGFLVAMGVFVLVFVKTEGRTKWWKAIALGVGFFTVCYLLFHLGLRLNWPDSLMADWLPGLSRTRWTAIF